MKTKSRVLTILGWAAITSIALSTLLTPVTAKIASASVSGETPGGSVVGSASVHPAPLTSTLVTNTASAGHLVFLPIVNQSGEDR